MKVVSWCFLGYSLEKCDLSIQYGQTRDTYRVLDLCLVRCSEARLYSMYVIQALGHLREAARAGYQPLFSLRPAIMLDIV